MKEIRPYLCQVTEPQDYLDRLALSCRPGATGYMDIACLTVDTQKLTKQRIQKFAATKNLAFADAIILFSQVCSNSAVRNVGNRSAFFEPSSAQLLFSYRKMLPHIKEDPHNEELYERDMGCGSFNANADIFFQKLAEYPHGYCLYEEDMLTALELLAERRLQQHSVGKIVEKAAFGDHLYEISEDTLEPTIKSEKLVRLVDEALQDMPGKKTVLEMGVGSGALLISVVKSDENRKGYGVDISDDALWIANRNVRRHQLNGRIQLLQGSWFEPLPQNLKFNVIFSNPPYLDPAEIENLSVSKKHEPYSAYSGGHLGLDPYKAILAQAKNFLEPKGQIIFEISKRQGQLVSDLMKENGFSAELFEDDFGRPRILRGCIK